MTSLKDSALSKRKVMRPAKKGKLSRAEIKIAVAEVSAKRKFSKSPSID